RAGMVGIQGLLPLLMKPRNGNRWTPAERVQLRCHLRSLTSLSPYLLVLLAPGSFVLLPLLSWWLDRRRLKRDSPGQTVLHAVQVTKDADRPSPSANV
ncbi:MAG: hypothetical protein Q8S75_12000, partial [Nitrospirota bacterium]|nr:hypothetical protein [Nitrospirota bacterium]